MDAILLFRGVLTYSQGYWKEWLKNVMINLSIQFNRSSNYMHHIVLGCESPWDMHKCFVSHVHNSNWKEGINPLLSHCPKIDDEWNGSLIFHPPTIFCNQKNIRKNLWWNSLYLCEFCGRKMICSLHVVHFVLQWFTTVDLLKIIILKYLWKKLTYNFKPIQMLDNNT